MIPQIINGLIFASILFLVATGLTIIWGILRVVNFAHGSFYLMGVFIAYSITRLSTDPALHLAAPFIAGAIAGIVGIAFERGLLKNVYGRGELFELLLTYGMIFVFMDVFRILWGSMPISDPTITFKLGVISLGGPVVPLYNIYLIVIAAVLAALLWFLLIKTKVGMIIRATSFDTEVTSAFGVNVNWVYALTFFLGCFLAGFAGGLMLPITGAWIGLDVDMLILALVVLVVGGMGSIKGALVASLLIGLVRSFGISMFPAIELAIVYLIMIVVLIVKPSGLFGGVEVEG
ncbi:branched-chain amino acid ABC transporter permease [Archaeoglobales archaeon]|nr:MAG: branched-chain amino acid ABC transporter permease [Archaeoglobales archaeon]